MFVQISGSGRQKIFPYLDVKYNVQMKNILPLEHKGQFWKLGIQKQSIYGFMIVQFLHSQVHRDEIPFQGHTNANDDVGSQYWICWLGISEINTVGSTKP